MKKIIALTLIFIIATSTIVFADMQTVRNDLTRFEIITNYELETVNRSEAAKIISTMLGQYDLNRRDTVFTDVKKEYWASGYIDFANKMGFINGHGDGTFAPEEKVTNEQMIKMLVCALGWEPAVGGNYPIAHFIKATELGITKGLDLKGTDIAKRSDVAVMVHNALDIPLMMQNGFGSYTQYVIMNGEAGTERKTLRMDLEELFPEENKAIKVEIYKTEDTEKNNQVSVFSSVNSGNTQLEKVENPSAPFFNGPEYTGALLKVKNLKKENGIITFKNSLNINDKATYVIDDKTYVWITNNTLPLEDIKNNSFVQCWYEIDEKDNIHLLKIEIMKTEPSMAN